MQSFRLGSIFGFEIRVDLSWFILFFLILWTFMAACFQAIIQDSPKLRISLWERSQRYYFLLRYWCTSFIITLGVVQLFGGLVFNGLWLILIGWFLNNAADNSYQQLVVRTSLEGVRVGELMTRSPETVSPNITLRELVDEYFLQQRYQAYPVTHNS